MEHTQHFDPEASQILAADLFDNLDNNEELRNSEDYFADFYEANENETLGKQSKVRTSMKQIYSDINNNKETIAANDSIIQSLLIKKSQNDSALFEGNLSETDSIDLINQNNSFIQQVNVSISEMNKMLKQNADSVVIKVAFSKDLNDNISPTTTIETNEQQFNDVFLRNMALGVYTLSETDLGTLQDIAIQCPFAGGKAVYKTRAYLAILGYLTIYDDETVCSEDENFRKAKKQHDAGFNVVVYTNPLKDECKFIYRLPKDEGADLHIYDSYGKEIYHNSLNANSVSYSVNLGNFTNGVYTYSVNSQNGLIGNGKLILIK